jgi:uncharacterized protein YbjT (DUF2867 family)
VKVCVVGASGGIGGPLVDRLLVGGHEVVAVSRSGSGRVGARDVRVDLEAEVPDGLTDGCAGLFLLSGWSRQAELLSGARSAGVRRVVVTSGVSAALDDDNPFTALQRGSEEAVAASGLPAAVLRLPALASNTLRWREQLRAGDEVREPYADRPYAVLHPTDVADVAYAALTGHELPAGVHRLSGPAAITARERLDELGTVLGRELWMREVPVAELEASDDPWVRAQVTLAEKTDESVVTPGVLDLTGHHPRTHLSWLEANAAAF